MTDNTESSHITNPATPGYNNYTPPQAATKITVAKSAEVQAANPPLKESGSAIIFSAIATMINALTSLNQYLSYFSNSILTSDLAKDNLYADQISALVLQSMNPNDPKSVQDKISLENKNALLEQQVVQARLKAHQNSEQMDIQDASSTTTNSQQLTSVISAIFQMSSQILQSVLGMSH
ncbi:MAG: hypothetical protein P4L16_06465 [Chlamydiales bacterium]|nr:hypothetical protein [Chlamydiales bacterium]